MLQIALVAFLLLMIGTVAFATRTYSGFFGAVNQSANREARDVAESAITEFQTTLNKEDNRYLLVYPHALWTTATLNPCTGTLNTSTGTTTGGNAVSQDVIDRFKPNSTTFRDLTASANTSTTKQFRVEQIEYRDAGRNTFTAPPDTLLAGASRGLIRVTVIGSVTRNGVTSTARVTREFEVIPKCCKRSFGKNTYGGANWGRDARACTYKRSINEGGNGIVGSLNASASGGSNNGSMKLVNENGNIISQAICYAGIPTPSSGTDLGPAANSGCINQTLSSGPMSYVPARFDLTLPDFPVLPAAAGSIFEGQSAAAEAQISLTGDRYIYFSTSKGRLRNCSVSGTTTLTISNCRNLDPGLTDVAANDPCVYRLADATSSPPRPYNEVLCRLDSLQAGNNSTLYIDTTGARINLFFDTNNSTTSSSDYLRASGNVTYKRLHCYADEYRSGTGAGLVGVPETNYTGDSAGATTAVAPCSTVPTPDKAVATNGITGFFALCSSVAPNDYTTGFGSLYGTTGTGPCVGWDLFELLNIYSLGPGTFRITGSGAAVGMNVYAPKASVSVNGGGTSCPNFLGRLWGNAITLNGLNGSQCPAGQGSVISPSSNPYFCGAPEQCPSRQGPSLFDFVARSFSHASGY